MQQPILLFIGGTEIVFILFIVVLVFGADKLPDATLIQWSKQ